MYVNFIKKIKGDYKMKGYCVKCKAKREMLNPKESTMKNGRLMAKGKCPKCDTTVCRILGNKK